MEGGGESDVLLVLADISGYTRFMLANERSMSHAQVIIAELMHTLIREVELPLQVAEVEGDAVFLYAVRTGDEAGWHAQCRRIGGDLERLMASFYAALARFAEASPCGCTACHGVQRLRIKVVAHAGTAIIDRIGGFRKVSGVATIVLHRMLKNGVDSDAYMFVTERAFDLLGYAGRSGFRPHRESYDEIGDIDGRVRLTEGVADPTAAGRPAFRFRLANLPLYLRATVTMARLRLGRRTRQAA